jgi:peptidoglycan/LPS O-acetylase OafA/YrhL
MLVALLIERRRALDASALSTRASLLLAGSALLVLVLNGVWHASDRSPGGFVEEAVADLPAAVAFAMLVGALVLGSGTGLRWLGFRPLAWFGQISYGFYLWHIPLIVWARGHGLLASGVPIDVAIVFPVALALGAASWYLIERPLMAKAAERSRASRRLSKPGPHDRVREPEAVAEDGRLLRVPV